MPRVDAPITANIAGAGIASGLVSSTPGAGMGSGLVAPSGLVSSSTASSAHNPNAVIPGTDFTIIDKPKRKAVILVFGDGGTGKCLGKGTPVLMFDGTNKPVEDVVVGDQLMGPDSLPRTVLSLGHGRDTMYRIVPTKGDPWICNSAHILTLLRPSTGRVIDISVTDYLQIRAESRMRDLVLLRSPVEFPGQPTALSPYIMGVWLGDGHRGCPIITTNKEEIVVELAGEAARLDLDLICRPDPRCNTSQWRFSTGPRGGDPATRQINPVLVEARRAEQDGFKVIPQEYLFNSRKVRLELLAGLIDTDGHLFSESCYEIVTKSPRLRDQIKFLARSLGMAAYDRVKIGKIDGKEVGTYYRITISGHTNEIPCRVSIKKAATRRQVKNVLRVGFVVEEIGPGEYFGFEITGDGRFLLGDTTITHNTTFGLKYLPHPTVLIGFDGRSQYVEEAMKIAGYPIPAVQIPPPSVLQKSDNVKASAQDALKKFFKNYDGAIQASLTGAVKKIVIDTGTELGGIIQLAVRGTMDQVKGDFGRSKDQINQIWWRIFGAARYTGNAHLIVLARAGAVWENNEPTGDFKAKIADEVRDAVDFALHIRLAPKLAGLAMAGGPGLVGPGGGMGLVAMGTAMGGVGGIQKEFELVVKKSGNTNPTKDLGLVLRESDWGEDGPFAYACSRLMPGSQPSDWR